MGDHEEELEYSFCADTGWARAAAAGVGRIVVSRSAQAASGRPAGRGGKIYRRVLAARPDHFDSLHLLGVIFYQRGDHAEAVRQINLALKRSPNNAPARNNRGNALWGSLDSPKRW